MKNQHHDNPADAGRKLNVHKTFRKRPGHFLNVLCMFNLRPVSTGKRKYCFILNLEMDHLSSFFINLGYDYLRRCIKPTFTVKLILNMKSKKLRFP